MSTSAGGSGDPDRPGARAAEEEQQPADSVFPLPEPPSGPDVVGRGVEPGASGVYQPPGRRGRLAMRTLVAAGVVDGLALLAGVAQLVVLTWIGAGQEPSEAVIEANDSVYQVVGLLQFALLLVGAVAFIHWLRLVYANLTALGHPDLRFHRGWAIFGWFVPIISFFRPKQIVNDVWRGSDPIGSSGGEETWREPVPALFGLWWAGWLIANIGSNAAGRYYLIAEEVGELQAATVAYLAFDAISALTAVLAWLVVRRTTRRQEERASRLGLGAELAGPPAPAAA